MRYTSRPMSGVHQELRAGRCIFRFGADNVCGLHSMHAMLCDDDDDNAKHNQSVAKWAQASPAEPFFRPILWFCDFRSMFAWTLPNSPFTIHSIHVFVPKNSLRR